jgi:hypothetical protein
MLPRADNLGTRPLAYVEAPTPVGQSTDARQEVYHRLNQIALGQQLPAKVLERLADGTFLVRVADASARMSLPVGAQVGDDLSMTLVERQPRPTFLLGAGTPSTSGDARATLSQAALLIDSLLQSAQQSGAVTAAIGKKPLLPSPSGNAAQLAAALQDGADASGLFYESHLAQWAAGSRPLSSIQREPQADRPGATDANGGTDAALLRHLAGQWLGNGRSLSDLAAELQARTGNGLQPGLESNALNSHSSFWPGHNSPCQARSLNGKSSAMPAAASMASRSSRIPGKAQSDLNYLRWAQCPRPCTSRETGSASWSALNRPTARRCCAAMARTWRRRSKQQARRWKH